MAPQTSRILIVLALLWLPACATLTAASVGLNAAGELQPCPSAPRCVSSQATDERHRISALQLIDGSDGSWQEVIATVARLPRTQIVTVTATYLHAEIISPWGFYTDDLELVRAAGEARLDLRSSSRLGYYDFDVNRDRVAALTAELRAQGLLWGER